jgi:excisionase family DNA binding protein
MAEVIESPYMNPEEAGKYLGVSLVTLQQWRYQGKGPAYMKIGGKVRYDRDDLDKWMRSQRVVPELNPRVA